MHSNAANDRQCRHITQPLNYDEFIPAQVLFGDLYHMKALASGRQLRGYNSQKYDSSVHHSLDEHKAACLPHMHVVINLVCARVGSYSRSSLRVCAPTLAVNEKEGFWRLALACVLSVK